MSDPRSGDAQACEHWRTCGQCVSQSTANALRAQSESRSEAARPEAHDAGHPHLIGGQFQSDKYPTCPRGKVPLSTKDATAQDLLWEYAQRRRPVDAEFATDLETALRSAGYVPRTAEASVKAAFVEGWSAAFDAFCSVDGPKNVEEAWDRRERDQQGGGSHAKEAGTRIVHEVRAGHLAEDGRSPGGAPVSPREGVHSAGLVAREADALPRVRGDGDAERSGSGEPVTCCEEHGAGAEWHSENCVTRANEPGAPTGPNASKARNLTDASIIEWAASWVPDVPPGQRDRFAASLREELGRRFPDFCEACNGTGFVEAPSHSVERSQFGVGTVGVYFCQKCKRATPSSCPECAAAIKFLEPYCQKHDPRSLRMKAKCKYCKKALSPDYNTCAACADERGP